MDEVPLWHVCQAEAQSEREYGNPFWDVTVQVRLTSPSGKQRAVDAFWDGGRIWRVRFAPDHVGEWRYRFTCSDPSDDGLHGPEGTVRCVPYEGENDLLRRGPLGLSADRSHLVYGDGTPFFWLADTAWNGVLRARAEDWARYLSMRYRQGFSAIQFVSTQWRGLARGPRGETAYQGTERIRLNPAFYQRLDAKVRAINERGLVAAPVLLWAVWEGDPGQALAEADAIRLARYIVARWGAYQVVWFLGGDGRYLGERGERWKRIGRAVFGERPDRLATMHPCGQSWVGEVFREEAWYGLIGYQSGHGSSAEHLRWLVQGPPAKQWAGTPPLPVINLEPNYEANPSYHEGGRFTDVEVRRAAYWSLLVSPPAGVTFGHNAIWVWGKKPQVPEGHERIGIVGPWQEGLASPGVESMRVLRAFFGALEWWLLRPAPDLLLEQPSKYDVRSFVAAARTPDGALAVGYLPTGGVIRLDLASLAQGRRARWYNPRSGVWTDAGPVSETDGTLTAPDSRDWVLCLADP